MLSVTIESIRTITKFVEDFDAETDQTKVDCRLTRLDQLYDKYVNTSIAVELLSGDNDESKSKFTKERRDMENTYYTLRDFLTTHQLNNTPVVPQATNVPTSVVRLPKIDLPTFDGNFNNWIPFRDAYRSLIHNNGSLGPIEKFHYLMAALEDPVKRLLDTTSITADNYKIAWGLLVSRYDNKRLLVKNHICSLFAIGPIRKESSASILELVDHFERHVKILAMLGDQTEGWSSLLVHMMCSCLDQHTLREWERSMGNDTDKIPAYHELITFLKHQARMLLSLASGTASFITRVNKPCLSTAHSVSPPVSPMIIAKICIICDQQHRMYDCETFKRMQLNEKHDIIRRKKLCWNCLSPGHLSRECRSKSCGKCNGRHHTLLHSPSSNDRSFNRLQGDPLTIIPSELTPPNSHTYCASSEYPSLTSKSTVHHATSMKAGVAAKTTPASTYSNVLLPTAVVKVHGQSGNWSFVRALLDSGSEANFITKEIVQSLGLSCTNQTAVITGMGGFTTNSNLSTVATVSSVDSSYTQTTMFCVLPQITTNLPVKSVDTSLWKIPSNLVLADPGFSTPQKIDMVIGAELFFHLLREGQVVLGDNRAANHPIIQRTTLGWVIGGPTAIEAPTLHARTIAMLTTRGPFTNGGRRRISI